MSADYTPDIDGEVCRSCGELVAEGCPTYWIADDDLWNEVEGGSGGVKCIRCFTIDCREAGITIYWKAVREPSLAEEALLEPV